MTLPSTTFELALTPRPCDICGRRELEKVWSFRHIAKTAHEHFLFNNTVVICPQCGFSFVSPCPAQEGLNRYYTDALSYFKNQDVAYSVDTRIRLAQKYIPQDSDVIEIGSNRMTGFHEECARHFRSFRTIELKPDCGSDFARADQVPPASCDAVLHFYVLEHISDPKAFLKQMHAILRDGGIMICEVPSTRNYPNYIGDFIYWEHLSHFTLGTLSRLARLCGFSLISDETLPCSHRCGFSAVFKKEKQDPGEVRFDSAEYAETMASYKITLGKKDYFFAEIDRIRGRMTEVTGRGGTVILWGVNDIMRRLVLDWPGLNDNMIFIDDDPRKADFLDGLTVRRPEEIANRIKTAQLAVLTTERFQPVILGKIQQQFNKEFSPAEVEVIDWNR